MLKVAFLGKGDDGSLERATLLSVIVQGTYHGISSCLHQLPGDIVLSLEIFALRERFPSYFDLFSQNSLVQVLINEASPWCLSHLAGIHLMTGFYMKDITCVAGAIFEHGCCQRPQKDPWNESVCFGFTRPCSGKNGENTLLLHRAPPRIMLATLAVAGIQFYSYILHVCKGRLVGLTWTHDFLFQSHQPLREYLYLTLPPFGRSVRGTAEKQKFRHLQRRLVMFYLLRVTC